MHKKLLELLRKLSPAELLRLEKFLHSPFFNESETMSRHFTFLKQFAPDFDVEQLTAEKAFQYHFPKEPFDRVLINKLNSQLFKLVENFLAHRQLEKNDFEKDLQLLQFYETEMLEKHYDFIYKRLLKIQKASNIQDLKHFQQALRLDISYSDYLGKKDDRVGDINLQAINQSLDNYFLLFKLVLFNMMVTREKFARLSYDYTWMDEVLAYLEEGNDRNIPSIQLYREVLLMQQFPEKEAHYFQLKKLLRKYSEELPVKEVKGFYTYLENSVKNVFSIEQYPEELFSLYELQLENKTIYFNGFLLHSHYRNITLIALSLKKFIWAEQFIQNHKEKIIPAEFGKDAYFLNQANWLYAKGRYNEAQEQLLQVNPSDIYYKLGHKSLLARIYFELGELDVLENYLNTFTKFIFDQKAKISTSKVASYRCFINYFRKLLKTLQADVEILDSFSQYGDLRGCKSKKPFQKIKKQIEKEKVFYGKKWLLDKMEQLLIN